MEFQTRTLKSPPSFLDRAVAMPTAFFGAVWALIVFLLLAVPAIIRSWITGRHDEAAVWLNLKVNAARTGDPTNEGLVKAIELAEMSGDTAELAASLAEQCRLAVANAAPRKEAILSEKAPQISDKMQYTGHVPCRKCGTTHWMHGPCPNQEPRGCKSGTCRAPRHRRLGDEEAERLRQVMIAGRQKGKTSVTGPRYIDLLKARLEEDRPNITKEEYERRLQQIRTIASRTAPDRRGESGQPESH